MLLNTAEMRTQRVKKFTTAIFLLSASFCITRVKSNVGSSPWQAIEISPAPLYQIDYGTRRIEIRDSLRNRNESDVNMKTYYVSPFCELDPFSAIRKWNSITKEFEVRFTVQMWDDELVQTAWEYLKENVYSSLPRSRVQLIPIQSVALRCTDCKGFGINGSPLRVTTLPRRVHFSLTCDTAEESDRLVELMKSDPEHFQILRLAFALQGQSLETKVLTVEFHSTLDGEWYSQIKRQLSGKTAAFLLQADEVRLKRQFLHDLQATYLWRSSDIQENYAQELRVGVHHFLVFNRGDSSRFNASLWQSLFWHNKDGLLRPDILAEELSKICKNYDTSLVQNWFQDTPSSTNYTKETKQAAEKEIKKCFKVKNVTEFVAKAREFVRWNGTHLVPKPLLLTKIYLADRIDASYNGSFRVTVQFSPAALFRDISIQVEDTHQEQTATKKQITAITEFLKNNLTQEIEQLKVRITEKEKKNLPTTFQHEKDHEELTEFVRNFATSTSVAEDQQALTHLAGLVAHINNNTYTVNQPVWYSFVRTNLNDLINSLNRYGLVSYLPPAESFWVISGEKDSAYVSLRNFWTKTEEHKGTISTASADTSVVWDPVSAELLYFDGKIFRQFPKENHRHYQHVELTRSIPTDAPWRHILDMSFDWITRNLYILSSNNYFIFVLSIENPYSWTQLRCSKTEDIIERLVVDPLGGYLFWSTKSSIIRRSWLNGDNVTTIWDQEGSYAISPWSLTLDHETGTLYIVDSSEKNIVALDRDGNVLKTIQLKWANGDEANLFEESKNLNKMPEGFIVVGPNQVYFLDLNSEIVHPVEATVPKALRYAVFSPTLSSYPNAVNPCSRTIFTDCSERSSFRSYNYHEGECWRFSKTPCGNKVCLHNPRGQYNCY